MIWQNIFIRKITPGQKHYKGYGYAYEDYVYQEVTCVLIPFNIVVSLWRRVYYIIIHGYRDSRICTLLKKEYFSGYNMGYKHGQLDKSNVRIIGKTEN